MHFPVSNDETVGVCVAVKVVYFFRNSFIKEQDLGEDISRYFDAELIILDPAVGVM